MLLSIGLRGGQTTRQAALPRGSRLDLRVGESKHGAWGRERLLKSADSEVQRSTPHRQPHHGPREGAR